MHGRVVVPERSGPPAALEQCSAPRHVARAAPTCQPWRFVVVREPARRQEIAALYADAWARYTAPAPPVAGRAARPERARGLATRRAPGAHAGRRSGADRRLHGGSPRQLQLRDEHGELLDAGSLCTSGVPRHADLMWPRPRCVWRPVSPRCTASGRPSSKACLGIPDGYRDRRPSCRSAALPSATGGDRDCPSGVSCSGTGRAAHGVDAAPASVAERTRQPPG